LNPPGVELADLHAERIEGLQQEVSIELALFSQISVVRVFVEHANAKELMRVMRARRR